ncbi:MAG: PQQ-binding-like beta-propeller repeat protein [Bacteroidaceae bacterium]|nr:PQQ-binding-like beta-propeller repeat protein [Bacteroidaceae bacterium]
MKKTLSLLAVVALALSLNAQEIIEWRGVGRTGLYQDSGLLKAWPQGGPQLLWSIDGIGEGYSQLGIANDRIYVTGMKGDNHMGYMSEIDLNGKLLQQKGYSEEWVGNYSGARGSVTISDGKMYHLTGLGMLVCVDQKTLNVVWKKDILKEFDAKMLQFAQNEAPLVVDDKVFITPGGSRNNIVALNKNTGDVVWVSQAKGEESAYASPIYISDVEVPQIIDMTQNSLLALNPKDGTLLWSYPFASRYNQQCNSPIYENGMLLFMNGNSGTMMLKLENGGRSVSKVWESTELANVFSAMVKVGNYIYGCNENNRYWVCLDWNTGKLMYKTRLRQCVPITADNMIYNYCDNGDVQLIAPDSSELKVVSSFKVTQGTEQHWAHPVIYKGVLYIRHGDSLMAYKIK